MANYIATDTDLQSVANAIRTKGGTSAQLTFPSGFVSAVENIPTGSGLSYEKNHLYIVKDCVADGYETGDVSVRFTARLYFYNTSGYTPVNIDIFFDASDSGSEQSVVDYNLEDYIPEGKTISDLQRVEIWIGPTTKNGGSVECFAFVIPESPLYPTSNRTCFQGSYSIDTQYIGLAMNGSIGTTANIYFQHIISEIATDHPWCWVAGMKAVYED